MLSIVFNLTKMKLPYVYHKRNFAIASLYPFLFLCGMIRGDVYIYEGYATSARDTFSLNEVFSPSLNCDLVYNPDHAAKSSFISLTIGRKLLCPVMGFKREYCICQEMGMPAVLL